MSAARMFVVKRGPSYLAGQRKDGFLIWSPQQPMGRRFSSAEQARIYLRNRFGAVANWDNLRPIRLLARGPR